MSAEPKLYKWPFLLGDACLVGVAVFIVQQTKLPMGPWELFFVVLCVTGGACLGIAPFLMEYRIQAKLAEARELASAATHRDLLQKVGDQITRASERWSDVQEGAEKTAEQAKGIASQMNEQVRGFTEFLQKSNDAEKAALRLEVDKLRRTEQDWVQITVRILDHVNALHAGAVRSGQRNVIEQVGNFQRACFDTARRVGVTPFVASAGEPFDKQRHQTVEGNGAGAEAVIAECLAAGYTFQGRLFRPALVRVEAAPEPEMPAQPELAISSAS